MNKMERFTQRARRVLSLAQEEAERLNHGTLDTQHLLLGLVVERGGIAGRVLWEMGLNLDAVREMVNQIAPTNTHMSDAPPDLSVGTKRVLELAVDEARRMGHHYIGTEHLLLGLIRLTEGGASDILKRSNMSTEEIRHQTRRVLSESPLSIKSPETESPSPKRVVGTSLNEYILHIVVRDAATNEQKAEFDIRLDRVWLELAKLINSALQGKEVQPVNWSSGDNQIEVFVEKAKD